MKLLTKNIMAKAEVTIITSTRAKPAPPESIDVGKRMPMRASKIIKVRRIATCETNLFKSGLLLDMR